MLKNLPVTEPKPDAREFIDILMGQAPQTRTPLIEYLVDEVIMRPVITEMLGRSWVSPAGDRESLRAWLDNFTQFWYRMGYDFVRFEQGFGFVENRLVTEDTAEGVDKPRAWADEHHGSIETWEDFERYPWPKLEDMDFFAFEYLNAHLPEGMGLISCHGGGIFEHLSWIMSYEGLALALYDNRDLVGAVAQKLGELMTGFYRHLLDLDQLIAVFPGDDMGFRTGTLIGPDDLREFCLPWHRRFAAMTHERGLPYFLHSCGNLEGIMGDLIEDVRIDGKHSYEDAIVPVEQFQMRYGEQIAVLGGMDIDRLTTGSPEQIREHTRFLIETCGGRGRYAVGSGNSIPSYIPAANYLAMVDEALNGHHG